MVKIKPLLLRVVFTLEVFTFCYVYLFGNQGMRALMHMQHENIDFQGDIVCLKDEIKIIKQEVGLYKSNPFYKEKLARERCQMSRPDDEIYYINSLIDKSLV